MINLIIKYRKYLIVFFVILSIFIFHILKVNSSYKKGYNEAIIENEIKLKEAKNIYLKEQQDKYKKEVDVFITEKKIIEKQNDLLNKEINKLKKDFGSFNKNCNLNENQIILINNLIDKVNKNNGDLK